MLHAQLLWTDGYLRKVGVYALLKDASNAEEDIYEDFTAELFKSQEVWLAFANQRRFL